jgi:hypothetical protein
MGNGPQKFLANGGGVCTYPGAASSTLLLARGNYGFCFCSIAFENRDAGLILRRLFARKLISALRARKTSWKWLMILSVDVKRSRLLADFESPDPEDLISCQILRPFGITGPGSAILFLYRSVEKLNVLMLATLSLELRGLNRQRWRNHFTFHCLL